MEELLEKFDLKKEITDLVEDYFYPPSNWRVLELGIFKYNKSLNAFCVYAGQGVPEPIYNGTAEYTIDILEEINNYFDLSPNYDDYTEEEKNYVNSPFYQNYKGILNNIDSVVAQTKAKITEIYQKNVQFYNNPYYKEISDSVVISGIGFPVPERFLNNLKQLIEIKMGDVSLEDGYVDVEIIPSEYMRQGNTVVKKTNAYQVKTTLKNIKTKTK